jgi:hypothetical protein
MDTFVPSNSPGAESALVSVRVLGADDGIRTRDPHLGKVPREALRTCIDEPIWSLSRAFTFPCNPALSRRFSVVDGTSMGPLVHVAGLILGPA